MKAQDWHFLTFSFNFHYALVLCLCVNLMFSLLFKENIDMDYYANFSKDLTSNKSFKLET